MKLTQEQLVIKLIWHEELNTEDKKVLRQDSLTLQFITNAIEKHLALVKFLPTAARVIGGPQFGGICLECKITQYRLPFTNLALIQKKYIMHSLGDHGEKSKKTYSNLLQAMKYYLAFHHNMVGGYVIKI